MDKFVYAVCDESEGTHVIKTIMGKDIHDAENRIMTKYFKEFDRLTDDSDWISFLDDLLLRYDISISDLKEINELID